MYNSNFLKCYKNNFNERGIKMRDFVLERMLDKLGVPKELRRIFSSGKKYIIPNSREELIELAMGGKNDVYDIEFDVPGKGKVKEAWATKVKNGVVVNYTDPYMRRREPDCLFVSDDKPTDKPRFEDKFKYNFNIYDFILVNFIF